MDGWRQSIGGLLAEWKMSEANWTLEQEIPDAVAAAEARQDEAFRRCWNSAGLGLGCMKKYTVRRILMCEGLQKSSRIKQKISGGYRMDTEMIRGAPCRMSEAFVGLGEEWKWKRRDGTAGGSGCGKPTRSV